VRVYTADHHSSTVTIDGVQFSVYRVWCDVIKPVTRKGYVVAMFITPTAAMAYARQRQQNEEGGLLPLTPYGNNDANTDYDSLKLLQDKPKPKRSYKTKDTGKQDLCSRCKRPGHKRPTCNFITHGITGEYIDDRN
tara:strand:- start:494 stop:901 length:408 start_codon:yes stop_codon:yes gene_type:complete